ncbi:hypothetical protein WJX74_005899 [Apatococcus lobatus]|uniref:AB hydrolase-1 domain-containing protein n=2 Tax=Apatococcus TaxID=904362 RepID=A0AAW1S3D9_9CHLO
MEDKAQGVQPSQDLSWWTRYTRWRQTSKPEGKSAEQRLLDLAGTNLMTNDVHLGPSSQHYMHTIEGGDPDAPPIVCIAGYGAGAAFFYRNMAGLASAFKLHAVDLLGCGMSGRPTFQARNTAQAEDFFIDSLSQWREKQGLDRMILVGHSLGGYLSACYALRHPQHISHLILVCPAGVASRPQDWQPPESLRNPWTMRGQMYRAGLRFWDWGVTPGTVIRGLGPWGPRLISGYTRRRFHEGQPMTEPELAAFEEYFYHITADRGSGEFALRHLLGPFAWARNALETRLHELKVPVSFIYGEHDWMDPRKGQKACRDVVERRGRLSPDDLQVTVVPKAGHYPFLDQPQVFMKALLQQTQRQQPSKAAQEGAMNTMKPPEDDTGDLDVVHLNTEPGVPDRFEATNGHVQPAKGS